MYNEVWFSQPIDTRPPKLLRELATPAILQQGTTQMTSTRNTVTPEHVTIPVVASDNEFYATCQHPSRLLHLVQKSPDKLFFVSFRPEGTLRARWYLVQVDMDQTELIVEQHGAPSQSGIYYVHFFTRHPADHDETDPLARWWPEWREYTTGVDSVIDYGTRVLFPPTRVPNAERFIAWADVVNLSDPTVCLLGPFNFMEPRHNYAGRSPSYRQYVPTELWAQLAELCVSNGILPPRLTLSQPSKDNQKKRGRT
jgi:hypothetical protein